ncbi:MAG: PTS sugar transporter subunit IIA [Pseudomonadota bacterium]|nr:PTS sugar transporter subunit IIA [Pseudomonadota bacterium]
MDIGELLADGGVVLRSGASSKRQALHTVAEAASQALGMPEGRIMEALLEREALGSTGLGSGVAVPHARLEGVSRVTAVFVRLETPVAYGAVDDRPVDLLFALFAPPRGGAEHLRALAAVSRALRSSEMREQLRQARTTDAIRALFVRDSIPATAA